MKHTKDKEIADGFTQPRFGGRIAMSETERQFKSIGWTQNPGDWNKWTHRLHGSQYFDPKLTDELMDMWITGFVAGKETFGTDTLDNLTAEVARLRDACNQAYLELVQEVGPFPDLDDDWDILHGIAAHLRLAVDKENTDGK